MVSEGEAGLEGEREGGRFDDNVRRKEGRQEVGERGVEGYGELKRNWLGREDVR